MWQLKTHRLPLPQRAQKPGANTSVIKDDVTSMADVEATISSTHFRIKGVVQAALTLHDQSFTSMSLATFNATMRPRVFGTQNLHHPTRTQPLDFFLMWSSWTALFGTATKTGLSRLLCLHGRLRTTPSQLGFVP